MTKQPDNSNNNCNRVSISAGNIKMGAIMSVSLPPCITCPHDAPCFKKCYARRMAARYRNTREAWARNWTIYQTSPAAYWMQIQAAAIMSKFFRYHVAGDIPDAAYLSGMIDTAHKCGGTMFLCFTKKYDIINNYLDAGGIIPDNLKIIFSGWGAYQPDNPHGLPVSEVIFKGQTAPDNWKICGGNCTTCTCRGIGCWQLQNGETIAFYEH